MSQPSALCLARQALPGQQPNGGRLPSSATCSRVAHPGDDRHFDHSRALAWQLDGESVRVALVLPRLDPAQTEAAALAQLGQQPRPVSELSVSGPGTVTWDGRELRFRPAPRSEDADRYEISGDLLLEWTGEHTCGAGDEHGHEPHCGWEPVIELAELTRMGQALRRTWFRARLHGEQQGEHQRVQVFAGPAHGTRGLLGVLTCRPEEAADLITLLGEAEA